MGGNREIESANGWQVAFEIRDLKVEISRSATIRRDPNYRRRLSCGFTTF